MDQCRQYQAQLLDHLYDLLDAGRGTGVGGPRGRLPGLPRRLGRRRARPAAARCRRQDRVPRRALRGAAVRDGRRAARRSAVTPPELATQRFRRWSVLAIAAVLLLAVGVPHGGAPDEHPRNARTRLAAAETRLAERQVALKQFNDTYADRTGKAVAEFQQAEVEALGAESELDLKLARTEREPAREGIVPRHQRARHAAAGGDERVPGGYPRLPGPARTGRTGVPRQGPGRAGRLRVQGQERRDLGAQAAARPAADAEARTVISRSPPRARPARRPVARAAAAGRPAVRHAPDDRQAALPARRDGLLPLADARPLHPQAAAGRLQPSVRRPRPAPGRDVTSPRAAVASPAWTASSPRARTASRSGASAPARTRSRPRPRAASTRCRSAT